MLNDDIRYLTDRALWETENLIKCIPDDLWEKRYDGLPMWKYIYHMLYSIIGGILIRAMRHTKTLIFIRNHWLI